MKTKDMKGNEYRYSKKLSVFVPKRKRDPMSREKRAIKARAIARILEAQLKELLQEGTAKDIAALQEIIQGGPRARNAQSRVKAIALKWAYGYGMPVQTVNANIKRTLADLINDSMNPNQPQVDADVATAASTIYDAEKDPDVN